MQLYSFMLSIDNFQTACMQEEPAQEIARILRAMADHIERSGVVNLDNQRLDDSTGERVGSIEVEHDGEQ